MSSGVDYFDAQLMNVTQSNYSNVTEGCERQSADFQYLLLPVVYSLVFVLAMAGNLTALVHFLHTRSVTHPSHIFLVNLCVIDLLFALTLPFNVVYHARRNDWPFGETMCKINGSLFFGNLYGSSLFLMLISLDRYLAVAHPLRALRMRSPKYRIILSCLVWAVLASAILYLTLRGPLTRPFPGTGHIACMENFSSQSWRGRISSVSLLAAAIGFFLPLLVIATCYPLIACKLLANVQVKEQGTSRSTMSSALSAHHVTGRVQKKALRMVLLVLGVFLVCFAPYHINQLVHTLHRMAVLSGCSAIRFTYPARRVAMALCSLNSCLDPVVYCLASENFHWDRRYWCCGALWRPMGWRNKMNQNLNHLTTIANREQNA
ncbi:lysophosphatidic acid receptor 6-like [Anguilla rostrata]|uniref:lysophosphatidic acid receptor 6-like n=1 Tax=Anguilla rostrata TaxID=7938 RepID=UPI0030D47A5D